MAKTFAHDPLDALASHRAAGTLARYGEAKTCAAGFARRPCDSEDAVSAAPCVGVDLAVIPALGQTDTARKGLCRSHQARLRASDARGPCCDARQERHDRPWCSCAHESRVYACGEDCWAEKYAS